jgi:hypothetical protein
LHDAAVGQHVCLGAAWRPAQQTATINPIWTCISNRLYPGRRQTHPNITLNLGLRWERETAPLEETRQLVRILDLTNPIPNTGHYHAIRSNGHFPGCHKFNGAMIYTSNKNPRMYVHRGTRSCRAPASPSD